MAKKTTRRRKLGAYKPPPAKTQEQYNMEFAEIFRHPDYVNSRSETRPFEERSAEMAALHRAEMTGRKIGKVIMILFLPVYVALVLIKTFFVHINTLMFLALFALMIYVIGLIFYLGVMQ